MPFSLKVSGKKKAVKPEAIKDNIKFLLFTGRPSYLLNYIYLNFTMIRNIIKNVTNVIDELRNEKGLTRHYYGDVVRFLFILAAVIMSVALPFLNTNLPVPVIFSILAILCIGALAGFTNPVLKSTAIINSGVSTIGLIVFEYYAVRAYITVSFINLMFVVNQILALIFLFAFYYSIKTLRAMLLNKQ